MRAVQRVSLDYANKLYDSINLGLFVEEITLRRSHKLSYFITGLLSIYSTEK